MRLRSLPYCAALALALAATPGWAQDAANKTKQAPAEKQTQTRSLAKPAPAPPTAAPRPKMDQAPKGDFDPSVARRATPAEVKEWMDAGKEVAILDVRGSISGNVPKGAVHVPSSKLADWAKDKAKDMLIVAYCT